MIASTTSSSATRTWRTACSSRRRSCSPATSSASRNICRPARLRDFEGRGKAIQTVLDFAEESKMRRQVRSAIGQVCEELLMNALYDAPVDANGQPMFADVD